jgi:multidrug resistance efflux pump
MFPSKILEANRWICEKREWLEHCANKHTKASKQSKQASKAYQNKQAMQANKQANKHPIQLQAIRNQDKAVGRVGFFVLRSVAGVGGSRGSDGFCFYRHL